MDYKTKGTCSTNIHFEVEDGKVKNVSFTGGCNGNLKGISALVEGMKVEDVIDKLEGTTCSFKPTSCPDQLAKAVQACIDSLS
jgi:uncharacterized protein (TIGR03905 family)